MGVMDRGCRLVNELVAGPEHAPRPLLILAHDQVVGERGRLPDAAWNCGVHVREERLLEDRLVVVLQALDARFRAVEEVEEVTLGRRRVVVWELPPVYARAN